MRATTKRSGKLDSGNTRPSKPVRYERSVHLADTIAARALERAKRAFGLEGFAVVAEIDFRDALEKKLDKDIGAYWVIEVCNPKLADRALAVDRKAGLLMPCKVAVWQEGPDTVVAALRPEIAAAITGSDALSAIAREAEEHIERALRHLDLPGVEPERSANTY